MKKIAILFFSLILIVPASGQPGHIRLNMVDPGDINKGDNDWFAYKGSVFYDLEAEPTIIPFDSHKDAKWQAYWEPYKLVVIAWDFVPKNPPGAKEWEVADVYILGNHYRVLVEYGYYTEVSTTEGGRCDGGMQFLSGDNKAVWFCDDGGYWWWPPWDLKMVAYLWAKPGSGYEYLGLSGTAVDLGYVFDTHVDGGIEVWFHMFDYFWFSGVNEQCYIKSIFGFPVEPGTDVRAPLSSRLSIEFEEVTSAGHVIWEYISGPELPSRFELLGGRFYDITTTADFSGWVEIGIDYSRMRYDVPEEMLQLYHYNGAWNDCTTYVDTINDIIYGRVDSLSTFAVVQNLNPTVLIEQVVTEVENLDIEQGVERNLNSKLESALKVLNDLNENNDVAAINSLEAFINAVEAQRGKKISEEEADALIDAVQQIIDTLTNG